MILKRISENVNLFVQVEEQSINCVLFSRGRGMPPRGAPARGGVTRGGPARGGAVRGAPTGRGGPPATPTRGAVAPRARPPASGPPQRMAPPPHQHTPATAAESYEEYVSITASGGQFWIVDVHRTIELYFIFNIIMIHTIKRCLNLNLSIM